MRRTGVRRFEALRAAYADRLEKPYLPLIADQWPLYCRADRLARYLAIVDLIRDTLAVPGDVAEFGTWHGATFILMAQVLRLEDPWGPKVVRCFDTFQGLQDFLPQDGIAASQHGDYKGCREDLDAVVDLHGLQERTVIHHGRIQETLPELLAHRPELMFSFALCDCDLYEPTAAILSVLPERISPGGIIAFDEWNLPEFPGEGIAVNEFLAGAGGGEFTVRGVPGTGQPTLCLCKR